MALESARSGCVGKEHLTSRKSMTAVVQKVVAKRYLSRVRGRQRPLQKGVVRARMPARDGGVVRMGPGGVGAENGIGT